MKYLSISLFSSFLILAPYSLLADEKSIPSELVGIQITKKVEDQDLRNLHNYGGTSAVRFTFIVKEKNIVQIMEKSVQIKDNTGWKCASFPRVSEEGEGACFIIEKEGEFMDKINETKVDGTIDIKIGTKLVPKSFSLLAFDEPLQMDNFLFTLLEGKLKIEGNHMLIKEIVVEQNEKTIESRGSSWSDKERTYNYEGIGKGVKITFSYWDELVTKKVSFSKS